jgi:RNA polymerase sigma-70 factor (ECF subfamily)
VATLEQRADQQQRAARDGRLVAEFRRGNAEAFDELVRTYSTTVSRLLTQLHAAPSDIDDLTQDVFLRVFRNLHHFRGQSSFSTWLYRITVNVFFDHRKKRQRADVRLARLHGAMVDPAVEPASDDPFRVTSEHLTAELFAQAVAALPEAFRDVVALREMDDLSYEEIATLTGITIGTVRSRLCRARARLRAVLGPQLVTAA